MGEAGPQGLKGQGMESCTIRIHTPENTGKHAAGLYLPWMGRCLRSRRTGVLALGDKMRKTGRVGIEKGRRTYSRKKTSCFMDFGIGIAGNIPNPKAAILQSLYRGGLSAWCPSPSRTTDHGPGTTDHDRFKSHSGLYNNYTTCWMTEFYKVISSQFIVLSGGGPHQMRWRAIFMHSFHWKWFIFLYKKAAFPS